MNTLNRRLGITTLLMFFAVLPILAACGTLNGTPFVTTSDERALQPMETPTIDFGTCETCADATLAALQTQEQGNVNAQAAATAEIMRANAQATLDAASSTLSAAQTQEQNNANIVAAQVAATAAIIRANAQATLKAAESTQSAAQTQDAIQQTQSVDATASQQNKEALAASTQTAVANAIATQTRAAAATSQWYADQTRRRNEAWQTPVTFLWACCLPLFIISIALAGFWAFWRWVKIRETQQRIEMRPASVVVIETKPNNPYPLAKAQDHVRQWLEEIKHKLLTGKKDDHDNPDR